jgi:hypothetical protein
MTVTLQRDNVAMTEIVRRVKLVGNSHPVGVLWQLGKYFPNCITMISVNMISST